MFKQNMFDSFGKKRSANKLSSFRHVLKLTVLICVCSADIRCDGSGWTGDKKTVCTSTSRESLCNKITEVQPKLKNIYLMN